jgi:hypothetical protein
MVVEALLVTIYSTCELILIDIRKSCQSGACLVRIASLCPAEPFQLVPASCGVRTCESPAKRGLYATLLYTLWLSICWNSFFPFQTQLQISEHLETIHHEHRAEKGCWRRMDLDE